MTNKYKILFVCVLLLIGSGAIFYFISNIAGQIAVNNIMSVKFYRMGSVDKDLYIVKKDKPIVEVKNSPHKIVEIVHKASRNSGIASMTAPEILISIGYKNGDIEDYFLWCNSPTGEGTIMSPDDTNITYSINQTAKAYLREILMSVQYFKNDNDGFDEILVADDKFGDRFETSKLMDVSGDARYMLFISGHENKKPLYIIWDNKNKKIVLQQSDDTIPPKFKFISTGGSRNLRKEKSTTEIIKETNMIKTKEITTAGISYISASPDGKRFMYSCGKTPIELWVYDITTKKHIPIYTFDQTGNEGEKEMRINSWWLEDGRIFVNILTTRNRDFKYRHYSARIIILDEKEITKKLDNGEIYKNIDKYFIHNGSIINLAWVTIYDVLPFNDGYLVLAGYIKKNPKIGLFYMEVGKDNIEKVDSSIINQEGVILKKVIYHGKTVIFGYTGELIRIDNIIREADYARMEINFKFGESVVKSLNPKKGCKKNGFIIVEDAVKKITDLRFYNTQSDTISVKDLEG